MEKNKFCVKENLTVLKEGLASCAIEGMYLSSEDKKFMENLFKRDLTDEAMIIEINKKLGVNAI